MPDFFYNKTVELQFDPDTHIYGRILRGENILDTEVIPVQGVTSVIKILDKSFVLTNWASKMCAEKILRTMPKQDADGRIATASLFWDDFEALVLEAKKAHKEILDDAGDVGKQAHKCLESSIQWAIDSNNGIVKELIDEPSDERALSCANAGFDWMKKHNVRWRCTERKVYSLKYNCAGTLDGMGLVDSCNDPVCCPIAFKNRLSLVDWKSANGLYLEFLLQSSAYEGFYEEEFPDELIEDRWINRLGKEDGKFESWHCLPEDFEDDFKAFLSCLTLYRIHDTIEKRMSEAKKARTARKKVAKGLNNDKSRKTSEGKI